MAEVSIIGLDIAKHVFHVHGADGKDGLYSASGSAGESCWISSRLSRFSE